MATRPLLETLRAAYLIVQWIFISSSLILYNKSLISGRFDHPITLVLLHMLFGACASGLWVVLGWETVPRIGFWTWVTSFVPIGVCFASSLALSNMAYVYISVAYIQMIKASTPVVVLCISFCFRIESPSMRLGGYILLISTGVSISCAAQVENSFVGTLIQFAALLSEGMRLCLINLLLTSRGLKLSAIGNLFYIAPTCFLCLFGPWVAFEAQTVLADNAAAFRSAGFLTLVSNSSVAFLLNLATLALIRHTSALTLNVAGVVKDILLILWSVIMTGATVTGLQYIGYTMTLIGATGYTAYKRRLAAEEAEAKAAEDRRRLLDEELSVGEDEDDEYEASGRGR